MTDVLAIVNAAGLLILVIVTIWYALTTAKMHREMRRQAQIAAVAAELGARASLAHLMMEEGKSKRRVEELSAELERLRKLD